MGLLLIGTGKMGQALARGFLQEKRLSPDAFWLMDLDVSRAREAAQSLGGQVAPSLEEGLGQADTVLIAVPPAAVSSLLVEAAPFLTSHTVLSLAAGVTLADLRRWAGPGPGLVRVMTNLPAQVGAAVSALACDGVDGDKAAEALALFAACGTAYHVPETALDAVTGLAGSGPAYVMLVIEALADGGVLQGLPRQLALDMAAMTVYGAARYVRETGQHPAQVKELIASPGGTTMAGLDHLEAQGFRSALMRAVSAAADRSRQLGDGHG